MADEESQLCSNCKRLIPKSNHLVHSIHCQKNIGLCAKCGEPVPHKLMNEHLQEVHKPVRCDECGQKLEHWKLEEHKEQFCSKRVKTCKYCELGCHMDKLQEHELYCGSRTEPCKLCGKLVMAKDVEKHAKIDCALEPNYEPVLLNNTKSYYGHSNLLKKENNNHIFKLPTDITMNTTNDEVASDGYFTDMNRKLPHKKSPLLFKKHSSWLNRDPVVPTSPPSDSRLPQELLSAEDSDEELQTALALSMMTMKDERRDSARTKITPTKNEASSNSSGVYLPCEFCDKLLPADSLVLHQSACRPDILHFVPKEPSTPPANLQSSQHGTDEAVWRDMLLRDSTFRPIEPALLQKNEVKNSHSTQDDMNNFIPCEVCKEVFPIDCFQEHQNYCYEAIRVLPMPETTSRQRIENSPSQSGQTKLPTESKETELAVSLPCEFCKELFPEELLLDHQSMCDPSFEPLQADRTYPKPRNYRNRASGLEANEAPKTRSHGKTKQKQKKHESNSSPEQESDLSLNFDKPTTCPEKRTLAHNGSQSKHKSKPEASPRSLSSDNLLQENRRRRRRLQSNDYMKSIDEKGYSELASNGDRVLHDEIEPELEGHHIEFLRHRYGGDKPRKTDRNLMNGACGSDNFKWPSCNKGERSKAQSSKKCNGNLETVSKAHRNSSLAQDTAETKKNNKRLLERPDLSDSLSLKRNIDLRESTRAYVDDALAEEKPYAVHQRSNYRVELPESDSSSYVWRDAEKNEGRLSYSRPTRSPISTHRYDLKSCRTALTQSSSPKSKLSPESKRTNDRK